MPNECPHTEIVTHLARDMWHGNGKPGMTTRMQRVEDELVDYKELIPRIRDYLTLAAEREVLQKEADKNRFWKTGLGIAIILFIMERGYGLIAIHLGLPR